LVHVSIILSSSRPKEAQGRGPWQKVLQGSGAVSLHFDLKYAQLDFKVHELLSDRLSQPEKDHCERSLLWAVRFRCSLSRLVLCVAQT
jgi:hypothetical protein